MSAPDDLAALAGTLSDDLADECLECGEVGAGLDPIAPCPESKRPCGHHCNCSWVHDHCHWCDAEFGEEGEMTTPPADTETP